MTLAFFNILRLKHECLFQFENNQFYLVAIRPNSWRKKNTKKFGSHRLFTFSDAAFLCDVSFRFSNDCCRYTAIGNFVILLFRMQRVMNCLFALQDFDFDVSLGISGQLRQKVKKSRTR